MSAARVCGRYGHFAPPEEIARLFGVASDFEYSPHFNIAPSHRALVALATDDGPRLGPLRWGFHVGDLAKGRRLINARSETVDSSPAFRTAFSRRRCVVPASGFYEWRKEATGKVPYWIHPVSQPMILMAGIWGRDPEVMNGASRQTGEAGYAVLTRTPTTQLAAIHTRMPVLLSRAQAKIWLDKNATPESLRHTFATVPEPLSAHAVSPYMNRAINDDPECIRPIEAPLF